MIRHKFQESPNLLHVLSPRAKFSLALRVPAKIGLHQDPIPALPSLPSAPRRESITLSSVWIHYPSLFFKNDA